MKGSKKEMEELVQFIDEHNCNTELQVRDCVKLYFANITWSLLKDEYLKLNADEKQVLVQKLFKRLIRKRRTR